MSTSEQLSNAADDLTAASQTYAQIAGELDGITVNMTQTVGALLETWFGLSSSSFATAQKQAARDAYRVIDALTSSAATMSTLAGVISQNEGAVRTYEFVSIESIDQTEIKNATTGMENAVTAIQHAASTASTQMAHAAVQLGAVCSTGNEPLPPGTADGVTSVYGKDGKPEPLTPADGGNGNGEPPGPPTTNDCNPDPKNPKLTWYQYTLGTLLSAVGAGVANTTNTFLTQGGVNTTTESVLISNLIGGALGPLNVMLGKKLTQLCGAQKYESFTLTIVGSMLGGILEGGLFGYYVIDPHLPRPSAKQQLLDEINGLEQTLKSDPNLTPAQKQQLEQEIQTLQNQVNQTK
jgi:uncharacterized protein YukE